MCAVSGVRVCSDCRGQRGERREGMARVEESLMASGARGAGLCAVSGVRIRGSCRARGRGERREGVFFKAKHISHMHASQHICTSYQLV